MAIETGLDDVRKIEQGFNLAALTSDSVAGY